MQEEIRCIICGRLLGKGKVVYFETKCTRCRALLAIKGQSIQVISQGKIKRNNQY